MSAAHGLAIEVTSPPAALTLTHAAPATTTATYTVTSTDLAWTMSIVAMASVTPGAMDRADCSTGALLGGSLATPMAWSSTTGGTSGTLSGTSAVVANGSLTQAVSVTYSQGLEPPDEPLAGDCYRLTATLRVVSG